MTYSVKNTGLILDLKKMNEKEFEAAAPHTSVLQYGTPVPNIGRSQADIQLSTFSANLYQLKYRCKCTTGNVAQGHGREEHKVKLSAIFTLRPCPHAISSHSTCA